MGRGQAKVKLRTTQARGPAAGRGCQAGTNPVQACPGGCGDARLVEDVTRLSARHWQALGLVVERGVFDTGQVATVLAVSRPTAHRLLELLHLVGLVSRLWRDEGRGHRWFYTMSRPGVTAWQQMVWQRGRPAPWQAGSRGLDVWQQHRLNQIFIDLIAYGRRRGDAQLLRWWHAIDADLWLRERGVAEPYCDGLGIWVEDGRPVTFTVHWLRPDRDYETGQMSITIGELIATFADVAVVNVACVVLGPGSDEHDVYDLLAEHPIRVPVATTTPVLLADHPDGAAGPVWAINAADTTSGIRRRLGELHPPAATTPTVPARTI